MISKTHRRDVVIGDIYKFTPEYHVRLFADPHPDDGRIFWVDFQIFEVVGHEGDEERKKFFTKKGAVSSLDTVYSYEEAEAAAEGFVKWDGCTQFDVGNGDKDCIGVHVDSRDDLRALFYAIEKARELAAEEMPGMDIGDEYKANKGRP